MKPDHEAAKKWATFADETIGPTSAYERNNARAYLDAMARLAKAEKERDGWKDAYFELIRAIGSTPGNSKSPVSIAHELMARLAKAEKVCEAFHRCRVISRVTKDGRTVAAIEDQARVQELYEAYTDYRAFLAAERK